MTTDQSSFFGLLLADDVPSLTSLVYLNKDGKVSIIPAKPVIPKLSPLELKPTYRKVYFPNKSNGPDVAASYKNVPVGIVPEHDANLVCSDVGMGLHMPMLDIDLGAALIPSSTVGHYHLYFAKAVTWESYCKLMDAMVECDLLEAGYVAAAKARGYTSLRPPGVKKKEGE